MVKLLQFAKLGRRSHSKSLFLVTTQFLVRCFLKAEERSGKRKEQLMKEEERKLGLLENENYLKKLFWSLFDDIAMIHRKSCGQLTTLVFVLFFFFFFQYCRWPVGQPSASQCTTDARKLHSCVSMVRGGGCMEVLTLKIPLTVWGSCQHCFLEEVLVGRLPYFLLSFDLTYYCDVV